MAAPFTYLALGDSYTIGEGVPPQASYPWQLVQLMRQQGRDIAPPVIIAKTGWTTGELLEAVEQAGITGKFDLVTLLIGVNNQYRHQTIEQYDLEFNVLLDLSVAFSKSGAPGVMVLSIPDWGVSPFAKDRDRRQIATEIDAFNAVNRAVSAEKNAGYFDITAENRKMAMNDGIFTADGLHLTAAVYQKWAKMLLPGASG